jgi:hypothetical protein
LKPVSRWAKRPGKPASLAVIDDVSENAILDQTPQTVEAFYAIADQQGWLVSEALEQALAALKRELAGQVRG